MLLVAIYLINAGVWFAVAILSIAVGNITAFIAQMVCVVFAVVLAMNNYYGVPGCAGGHVDA